MTKLLCSHLLFLALFCGCNGTGSIFKFSSAGKIVDGSKNAEIRQAAMEDNSFPSATEPAKKQ
jgi:hypothetical protein